VKVRGGNWKKGISVPKREKIGGAGKEDEKGRVVGRVGSHYTQRQVKDVSVPEKKTGPVKKGREASCRPQ